MSAVRQTDVVRHMRDSDHLVRLYQDDRSLIELVGQYVAAGLEAGDAVLVVATGGHRRALQSDLKQRGVDVPGALSRGTLTLLDAARTLSTFMKDGQPRWKPFSATAGAAIEAASSRAAPGAGVRAYGEMVNLLWEEGNLLGALSLERFWNDLAGTHAFSLFCSYRIDNFDHNVHGLPLEGICRTHSHVLPSEDHVEFESAVDRAFVDVLGERDAETLRPLIRRDYRRVPGMPRPQAMLFWLRKNLPSIADHVLLRARSFYDATQAGRAS